MLKGTIDDRAVADSTLSLKLGPASFAEPLPGLVVRYSCLWKREYDEGPGEAIDDHPCDRSVEHGLLSHACDGLLRVSSATKPHGSAERNERIP